MRFTISFSRGESAVCTLFVAGNLKSKTQERRHRHRTKLSKPLELDRHHFPSPAKFWILDPKTHCAGCGRVPCIYSPTVPSGGCKHQVRNSAFCRRRKLFWVLQMVSTANLAIFPHRRARSAKKLNRFHSMTSSIPSGILYYAPQITIVREDGSGT